MANKKESDRLKKVKELSNSMILAQSLNEDEIKADALEEIHLEKTVIEFANDLNIPVHLVRAKINTSLITLNARGLLSKSMQECLSAILQKTPAPSQLTIRQYAAIYELPLDKILSYLNSIGPRCDAEDELKLSIREILEGMYHNQKQNEAITEEERKAKVEAYKLEQQKEIELEALKQQYRESMINFNFDNLYIIGEKEETDKPNIMSYTLRCYQNELDEIYTTAWDNEEALIKWKNANSIEDEHCAIDCPSFEGLILKNSQIKWALLNLLPEMADYDAAESLGVVKMMLLSAHGVWPLLNHSLPTLGRDANIMPMLKQLASENINMTLNEFVSNIDKLLEEKTSSLCTIRPPVEQFEYDLKLEHVVLTGIHYIDIDSSEFAMGDIDLFGHCFQLTYGIYNKVINAVFDSTKELAFDVLDIDSAAYKNLLDPADTKNIKAIFFNEIEATLTTKLKLNDNLNLTSITLFLSEENTKTLSEHFRKNNLIYFLLYKDANLISSKLLERRELVEIGKNFINQSPDSFYTDVDCLLIVENGIGVICRDSSSILLSSEEQRHVCFSEKGDKFKDILSHYYHQLAMFTDLLMKESSVSDRGDYILVAYIFIYNVVIEHLAQKWENDYQQYFQDIRELNLNEAIERYCSIDTVVHNDNVSLGRFIYYLIKNGKFDNNDRNYLTCREVVIPKLNQLMENKKYNNFVNRLKTSTTSSQIKYTINDVDLMNGLEFETFIAELFSKMGYESEITKASGDQGIDVIASKNGNTIGIQAKCYSSSVGNSAIQEAVAGKNHYRLDKAIVVTNNFFTDSAQQLAQSNSIILWDRHILKEKIDESFNSSR